MCTQLSPPVFLFHNQKNYSLVEFQSFAIIINAIRRSFLTKSATATMFTSVRVDLDSQLSRHIPALFRPEIENFICSNSSVSVVVRQSLIPNFMVTICSFPPSMTYKEN
jgi:hypothetical protein